MVAAVNGTVRCLPKPGSHEKEPAQRPWRWMQPGSSPGRDQHLLYVRRAHNRGGEPVLWRSRWLKWLVVVDADRQMVLAQEACSGPYSGSAAMLRPLVDAAHAVILRSAW